MAKKTPPPEGPPPPPPGGPPPPQNKSGTQLEIQKKARQKSVANAKAQRQKEEEEQKKKITEDVKASEAERRREEEAEDAQQKAEKVMRLEAAAKAQDAKIASTATFQEQSGEAAKKLRTLSESEFAKMEIFSYEKIANAYKQISKFKVSINPQNYKRVYSIPGTVDDKKKANKEVVTNKVVEFKETLSFDLYFDCTGAIPDTNEVKDDLAWLTSNLASFDGEMHATRYVKIKWGVLDFFYGQLKSMSFDYLYFDRNGQAMRAKVSLSFERIVSTNKQEAKSPDLTHIREVQEGDTLPGMCARIYKDPIYYLKVAEINGLTHFTNLQPGQRIYFPPLKT